MISSSSLRFSILFVIILFLNSVLLIYRICNKKLLVKFNTVNKEFISEFNALIHHSLNNLDSFKLEETLSEKEIHQILPYTNKSRFVFRFSCSSCDACIENEFDFLRKYKGTIKNENILLLISCPNIFEAQALLISNKLNNIEYIFIEEDMFCKSLNFKTNETLYFILDVNQNIKYVFRPQKDVDNLTEMYYKRVIEQYFTPTKDI